MEDLTIKEFIQKTIEEIESALPTAYAVDESIKFEISVTTMKTKGGGIDLKVVSGKLSDDKEVVQKINFSIVNAEQRDLEFKNSGNTFINIISKGLKQISKVSAEIDRKNKTKNISL